MTSQFQYGRVRAQVRVRVCVPVGVRTYILAHSRVCTCESRCLHQCVHGFATLQHNQTSGADTQNMSSHVLFGCRKVTLVKKRAPG